MKNNYISKLHFISKHLFTLLVLGLLFIGVGSVNAQAVGDYGTRYTSGNWNTANHWVICITANTWLGATVSAAVPNNTKNVWIRTGSTYTFNATATCLNLNIQDGATLTVPNVSFTVSGTTTVGGGTSGSLNITSTSGTKTFIRLVTVNAGATWNNSANEAINFRGGITNNGTFTAGTGINTFNTNNQTLTGIFIIPKVTITGITLTNVNTLTVGTALIGTGSLTQETNATLNIGGTSTITGLTATNTGNTVNYTGAAQTIHSNNYYNLTLSGSNTKTLLAGTTNIDGNLTLSGTASTSTVANLSIGGNLDIGDGTTLNAAAYNFTVVGTTKVGDSSSGILNITSINGTKTFQGDVTINAGAIWNNSAGSDIAFQGSLTNNSAFNAGNGIHSFSGSNETIGGTTANTIPTVEITGTYTNDGTLTVGTDLSGTGSLTQAANATLNIGGTSTIAGLAATNTDNTVNYTAGTNQNIHTNGYYNLTLSGNATKTAAAGLTIGGNVNIGSGTTFDGGSFTHIVAGNWSNDGTFTAGTGTLSMTGSGKTIGGSSISAFNNLSPSGTASISTAANVTVANSLSIGNGTSFTTGAYDLTVTGTTTIGTGTLTIGAYNGTKIFKGLLLVNSGGTWNNSGNSPVTFQGGITNNGTFTSGSGYHTFDTNAQELTGTINLSGAAISVTDIELTNKGSLSLTENLLGGIGTLSNATTGTINISGNQTSSIGTLTNQGIVNIAGSYGINTSNFTNTGTINLSGTGYIASITNNAGGTVNLNASHNIQSFDNSTGTSVLNINALTYTINTLTATAADNTVNYNGTGDQAIKNVPYSNLIVSGSGTKTFTGNTAIAKTFTNNGVIVNLGTESTHTANSYYLSGIEQAAGSWGGIGFGATNTSSDFTATTGILEVASGACIAGTWTGATNTDWNTATNWCGDVLPNSSTNVIIPNVANKPTITAAAVCNDITISAGSSLTISGTNTLTISGNFTNNGTFTANNTTVTFDGSTSQSITGTTFDNLIVSGTGTKTFAAGTTISNTFTNNNAVVNLGTGTHTANAYYLGATRQLMGSWGGNSSAATNINATNFADATGILNVTNGPCTAGYWKGTTSTDWNTASNWCDDAIPTATTDVIIPASAPNQPIIGPVGGVCHNITIELGATLTTAGASSLTVSGSFTNNSNFTANSGSVIFNGTTAQSISGSASSTFYNLTMLNSGPNGNNSVTLNQPITIADKGTLLLASGNIITSLTNILTINNPVNSGIMGGSSASFIKGPAIWNIPYNLTTPTTYLFPVGDTYYLPFTVISPTTGWWPLPTLQVQAFNQDAGGNKGTLSSISTSEHWSLSISGSVTPATVSLGNTQSIYPYNVIAGSNSKNGTYTALGGTANFYDVSNSTNIGANRYFVLAGDGTPKINIAQLLLGGFAYIVNFGPSAEQTFTVNGSSLSSGILINAPTNFEISLTSGTGFQNAITLPVVNNNVPSTIVYLRLKAGLAIGSYPSEQISLTSTGATTVQITCNGTVFASTPTITTSGGRLCPPNEDKVQLSSTGNNIDILYWSGPNNFYSQKDTLISSAGPSYNGTYTVTGTLPTGANLLINGDFEAGNVGFLSSYSYINVTASNTNNTAEGIYAVIANPKWLHNGFDELSIDHTPAPGTLQMVINGATTANVTVWSETVKVVPNSTYQFTYWLQSVVNGNPSIIQLYANNQPVGTPFTAIQATRNYKKYYYNWYSGSSTSVTLDLRNMNTIAGGNDFAMDDIDFRTVTYVSSSLEVSASTAAAVSISTPTTTVPNGIGITFSATPTNGGTAPLYQWKVNGINVGTNSSSSVFNYAPSHGDVITCVMTSNNSCTDPKIATSNEINMNVTGDKNLWIGTKSTVWNDPANWTKNIPAKGDNVEFATGGPTGNNGTNGWAVNDLHVDYNRIIGNLINNASGKNLVIPADKEVEVNNLITLTPVDAASTYDQIQIKCDPNPIDASRLPNGSIIFKNASNVNGTVEMYSKAYIDINADLNSNQRYFWQYFGIPVESITAEPTLYGAYVRKSNESGIDDDSNYYWTELTNSSTLNAFEGFEICQPVATTYTFKGKLVNSSLNKTSLPYTTGAFYPGEHLLANPYTAAIDVSKMNFGTNVEAAVYLYNTGSYGQWSTATDFGNDPGQYQTIPKEPAGNNSLPREVPSMSSMLIKVTDANNTGISFNYSDVIKKNESIQRVKSIDAISNTDLVSTMIDLTGLHYSDRMWIFSEPSCTRNFDNGWDGRKILGSSLAPQIFAIEPDGDYQVNSVSDMHNTDLAFQAGDEVEYTLKFTHENIQRQYAGVYLVDLVENKTVDVSQNGSSYTFATAQSDAPAKRFKILTRPYEKGAPDKEAQVKIFTAPGRVFVHNLSTFKGECTLYDIAGRAIKNAPFEANAVTEVLNNLTPGAYVVNTITNGEKVSKRVIVQ